MNKDDFDLLHQLRRDTADDVALNLVKGLYDRQNGFFKKNFKSKENVETFAEEEFIRKKDFNEMRCEMPGMPRSTFLMVFSPDGTKVASTHGNHIIYITDLRNGKNIRTLEGHPRTPWCIAFHPTSDQIVASGCLGGQVRIWDLSGGSEVWTAVNQTVIASLAFHPNDRVLAIATYNGVYFWDWSQPEPFVHAATFNIKEKVRYVAFDALGHKLITGIANSPMTRWERVRAPVPVPRQERCASPYRRRITQRLVNVAAPSQSQAPVAASEPSTSRGQGDSTSTPERQRRITMCYRTLVKEYEQLVQRYLQLYRPPLMIDRGTDPMEPTSSPNRDSESSASRHADGGSTSVAGPSGSSNEPGGSGDAVASTSGTSRFDRRAQSSCDVAEGGSRNESEETTTPSTSASAQSPSKSAHNLLTPSRIFSVIKKPNTLIRGTQTSESKKHKAQDGGEPKEKRFKKNDGSKAKKVASVTARRPETTDTRPRLVVINMPMFRSEQYRNILDSDSNAAGSSSSRLRSAVNEMGGDTSQYNVEKLLSNIRRTAEQEVRNRILPIIRSVPANDRPELIRLFENSRENVRMRFRRINPCPRKFNRLPVVTTSDSSSSDEHSTSDHVTRRNSEPPSPPRIVSPAAAVVSSTDASSSNPNISATGVHSVRNFNTELEQLVTSLLNEIEVNETQDTTAEGNLNADSQTSREGLGNTVYRQPQPLTLWNTSPVPLPLSPSPSPVPVDLRSTIETPPPPIRSPPPRVRSPPPNPNPPADSGNGNLFQEIMQLFQNRQDYHAGNTENRHNGAERQSASPAGLGPSNVLSNTSTRTTNSAVYTTSSGGNVQLPPRRRFFSHRISAFMPTRVNYNRSPNRMRRSSLQLPRAMRLGTRGLGATSTFGLDELINFSALENSEDDPPPPPPPPDENHPADPTNPESDISSMYSNIVQELESSLENVVRLRISRRPGETSNMLSSFSERLESILNQSSVILRNLHSSMEMITTGTRRFNTAETSADSPTWNYFDPSFYVRDRRAAAAPAAASPPPDAEGGVAGDAFAAPLASVAADHTYPRSAAEGGAAPRQAGGPPMVATIHLTILHIQRQARLLRQQVETIEQIDRAMLEVEQLRLVRTMILALERHVRPVRENAQSTRSTNRLSMSSMRQMMAGTRISDSSPYDSPAEAPPHSAGSPGPSNAPPGEAASSSSSSAPGDSRRAGSSGQTTRQRSSHRKTYPPSRMFRSSRQSRRPLLLNFFSRRILHRADRARQNSQSRPPTRSTTNNQDPSSNRLPPINSAYSSLDFNRLTMMTRRLEQMLAEQMRVFTSAERPRTTGANRSTAMLGEHILALRLHGCVLRMNRVIGFPIRDSRTDPTAAVTRDGVARYNARHLVSLVVDCVSRHLEEFVSADVPAGTRVLTRGALAVSLMINELLQMMVVDSIPPPGRIDFNPETGALASRIEMLCGQMLQYSLPRSSTGALQQSTYSQQLTRSLRLMRLTMRHAHRALGQTYYARRNAMQPRPSHQRRHLIGSLNRFLRIVSSRRQASSASQNNTLSQDEADTTSSTPPATYNDWYATITDLMSQIAAFNRDDYIDASQPSTSNRDRVATAQNDASSNNENTDDDDDDEDDNLGYSLNTSSNLYRANNINLAPSNGEPSPAASSSRPWNVPSVHVNDVPMTEQSVSIAQRMISQRQRIAERVSELRSNPHVGLFRPRFLHPLYASVNPFDADLDDPQREQIYDSDMITTVTPNHRIQAWDVSDWNIPNIGSPTRNIVVSECKIHNDASVDIAKDGTILVTLLPSGGYLNVTNRLGVYSLRWETLGQCLYTTNFEQNAVSVSLSPLGRHLVVGLASRLVPSDRWIMARVFKIEQKDEPGDRLPVVRELEQSRESRINCIRWLPTSGQGLIYATNTGQLVVLT